MIGVGDIVRVRQFPDALFVVAGAAGPGWFRCIADLENEKGEQAGFTTRIVGKGDLELVVSPAFEPGMKVRHQGVDAEIVEVHADVIRVAVPERAHRFRPFHREGIHLRIPASQTDVGRADLVLQNLEALI